MKSGHTSQRPSSVSGRGIQRAPRLASRLAALALGLAPVATSAPSGAALLPIGAQETDWALVPIRALSGDPKQRGALLDGQHLVWPDEEAAALAADLGPELPLRLAEDLAIEAASAAGGNVQLLDGSLLVRGPAASHAAARGALEALDSALAQLRFDVEVRLSVAGSTGAPLIEERRPIRAGGLGVFGQQQTHAYVHGYRIEVAQDVAIGTPEVGQALVGDLLHLWASTTIGAGGERELFVQGFLDVSRLTSLDPFDTELLDLGLVEQPVLESTQVMFAGTVPKEGALRLSVSGPTEETAQLTLEVSATALRAGAANPAVVDLSRGLWRSRLRTPHVFAPDGPPLLPPGETPAGLAQLEARQFPTRGAQPPRSTESLLFAQASSPTSARRLRRLREALDPLSAPAEVKVAWDDFSATIPTVAGALVRVGRTRETTMVVGYSPELANDAALCRPVIEHVVTGTVVEAVLRGDEVVGHGVRLGLSTTRLHVPGNGDSGRLQLPVRSRRSFPLRLLAERREQPDVGVIASWSYPPGDDR